MEQVIDRWRKRGRIQRMFNLPSTSGTMIDTIKPYLAFRRDFREVIAATREAELEDIRGGRPICGNTWSVFESGVAQYDNSFGRVLQELGYSSFRDWMQARKDIGGTTHILDVMGGNGAFLRDLGGSGLLDRSLVVNLTDESSSGHAWVGENKRKQIDILAGDITSGKTWHGVGAWLAEQGISGFDLVVCHGVNGVDSENIPLATYPSIGERMYTHTTSENGLLLSQVAKEIKYHSSDVKKAFSGIPGLQFFYQSYSADVGSRSVGAWYPAVGIRKTKEAPTAMPWLV